MKKLNLGCGWDKKDGYDNFDEDDFDLNVFPYPIKDKTYDFILFQNVIEHLDYPYKVLKELHRILRKDGVIKITCSHHNDESAYASFQHKHYFNEWVFKDFIIHNPIFKLEYLKVKPTIVGKFVPYWIRNQLAKHIGHLKGKIICFYRKIEKEKSN